MSAFNERLARAFLSIASPLRGLRRVPVLGAWVGWLSGKIVPRDSRIWVQVQEGPAAGVWLRVNPRTGTTLYHGSGEPAVQKVLQERLRPGMTFFDVGANIGFFSLLAAKCVGPTGRVMSFEADPEAESRLRENVAYNKFNWVRVEHKAVWSNSAPVFFLRADPTVSPDRGLGHVVSGPGADTIQINSISLDDYVKASGPPDFIKCDVEGAEVEVFRGAQELLKTHRAKILCEMHGEENRRVLLEEFARLHYSCQTIDETHILAMPT